jgi:hypothetical protein
MVDLFPQEGPNNGWNLETDTATGAQGEINNLPGGVTQIKVMEVGDFEWNVRTIAPLPTLRPNTYYILSFSARADGDHPITVRVQHDRPPYEELKLFRTPQLTNQWQQFHWDFTTPSTTQVGHGSLVLGLSRTTGTVEIRNVHLVTFDDSSAAEHTKGQ